MERLLVGQRPCACQAHVQPREAIRKARPPAQCQAPGLFPLSCSAAWPDTGRYALQIDGIRMSVFLCETHAHYAKAMKGVVLVKVRQTLLVRRLKEAAEQHGWTP
jgi:hypothetical protein